MSLLAPSNIYVNVVRITHDESGAPVDWVGCFGGLQDPLAVGYAYSARRDGDGAVLEQVGEGYLLRLATKRLRYDPTGWVLWHRNTDVAERFKFTPAVVKFPCLSYHDVRGSDALFDDPEYRDLQRWIVTLTPHTTPNGAVVRFDTARE